MKSNHTSRAIDAYDEHTKYALQADSVIALLLCDEQYKIVSDEVLSAALWLVGDLNDRMKVTFETLYTEARK